MQKNKTDILTRAVSTGVFTNSVFCVSLNFACFGENTIRIVVSAKQTKTQHKNDKCSKLKLVQV